MAVTINLEINNKKVKRSRNKKYVVVILHTKFRIFLNS